ncbi:hypothetical protein ACXY7N_26050 [Bacillus toyonensis]
MWESNIWAGMLQGGGRGGEPGQFNSIGARWNVPAIASTPIDSNAQVLIWIGIGGGGPYRGQPDTHNVVQIGTGAGYDASHTPLYFAWWETYGVPGDTGVNKILPSSTYPVKPGDSISSQMWSDGGNWGIAIDNITQGWTWSQPIIYNGDRSTAEFIVEAPQDASGIPYPLAKYDQVVFDYCMVNGQYANFDYGDMGDMVDPKNPSNYISRTSTPDSDRDGFTVAYGNRSPVPPSS